MAETFADYELLDKEYESREELHNRLMGTAQPALKRDSWQPQKSDDMFMDEYVELHRELCGKANYIWQRYVSGSTCTRLQLPDHHVIVLEAEINRGNMHPDIFLHCFEYIAIGLKQNALYRFVKSKMQDNGKGRENQFWK